MAQRYTKIQKQNLWETWIRQNIYADDGVYNVAPRHEVMRHFIEKGVFPFVQKKGYRFRENPQKVTNSFLRYLFAVYLNEKIQFLNPHKDEDSSHFDEFDHVFDTMEMEPFWEKWGSIQDFAPDHYAEKVRSTIPYFIWASLNLTNSPAYIKLEKIMNEVDEFEITNRKESKAKEDPYLQESSKYNYEDRHY